MIIRVIDFETTGKEPPAEVCEVGFCDVDTAFPSSLRQLGSWFCGVKSMPPEVRAVHHISLLDTAGEAPFDPSTMYDEGVEAFAAHNASFEAQFFEPAIPLICTYKAALRVWPDAPAHSNGTLRYWLEDQGLIKPFHDLTQPAHRAGPDAYVTAWILCALLDTGVTVENLIAWSAEPAVLATCPIGKHRGKPWAEIDDGYLRWMVGAPDMGEDLKWNAQRELERRAAA